MDGLPVQMISSDIAGFKDPPGMISERLPRSQPNAGFWHLASGQLQWFTGLERLRYRSAQALGE